jgi:hypothetical protein
MGGLPTEKAIKNAENIEARSPSQNTLNDGNTPLLVAVREKQRELTQLLLNNGAYFNATEPVFGAVTLHKAITTETCQRLAALACDIANGKLSGSCRRKPHVSPLPIWF